MRKNLFKRIFSVLLAFALLFSLVACKPNHKEAVTPKVILFIGDGMGPNHVYNAELYYEEQMYFSSFETKTFVDTNSLSGLTDSAAAATAMATGTRTINSLVAKDLSGDLPSITEIAKQNKYGVGVVTSDLISGATPAGFSAHSDSRDNSAKILLSQSTQNIDLLLGAGDYAIYKTKFTENGWTWVTSFTQLSLKNKRYVATFEEVVPENPTDEAPTLTQLACYAVDFMEKNYPTGYFLMIEGAKIDKASHNKDIQTMLKNMLDFSNAIKAVDAKLEGNRYDYSIIVTADHETGNLQKASSKENIANSLYKSNNHTTTNVNLYFKSTATVSCEILTKKLILNTDIFLLCKYLLAV